MNVSHYMLLYGKNALRPFCSVPFLFFAARLSHYNFQAIVCCLSLYNHGPPTKWNSPLGNWQEQLCTHVDLPRISGNQAFPEWERDNRNAHGNRSFSSKWGSLHGSLFAVWCGAIMGVKMFAASLWTSSLQSVKHASGQSGRLCTEHRWVVHVCDYVKARPSLKHVGVPWMGTILILLNTVRLGLRELVWVLCFLRRNKPLNPSSKSQLWRLNYC